MAAFKPYTVATDLPEPAGVVRLCNELCFPLTSPFGLTDGIGSFAALLLFLKMEQRIELAFLRDSQGPVANDKVRVMLRHDVDHDVVAALEMCRLERAFGVPATYYLHHASAYYYGKFDDEGVFHRYEGAAPLYREIQASGAEVGLHVDAFSVFQKGVDGIEAVTGELAWLRSQGLNVRGTTAHGSAPYFGAENFEIFRERKVVPQETLRINGGTVALGCLSEQDLGLQYEGNFASRAGNSGPERLAEYLSQPLENDLREHLRRYLHANPHARWGQDYTAWLHGRDRWALASTDPAGTFVFDASLREVFRFLRDVPCASRVVLHIHPCYYGFRRSGLESPLPWEDTFFSSAVPGGLALLSQLGDATKRLSDWDVRAAGLEARLAALDQGMAGLGNTMTHVGTILENARKRRVGRYIF